MNLSIPPVVAHRLKGKVAMITGCDHGIGTVIAGLFSAHGAEIILNVLHDDDNSRALRDHLGRDHTFLAHADITDRHAIQLRVEEALKRFGRIDILVNNAGINVYRDPLQLSDDDWERCLSVDLKGAWNCTKAVLPAMLAQGAGSVINIASVHGHKIIPGCFPYPVAKHGLIGLTRALAIEYAARGIRVNSISPGLVLTPIAEAMFRSASDPTAERARQENILPCKRIGEPIEVAYTALFLASDEARYINATDILIDGGRSHLYHD